MAKCLVLPVLLLLAVYLIAKYMFYFMLEALGYEF